MRRTLVLVVSWLGLPLGAGCAVSRGPAERVDLQPPSAPRIEERRKERALENEPGEKLVASERFVPEELQRFLILSAGLPGDDARVNQDLTARFQNETTGAVDPRDPLHVVAAWCDNSFFDPAFNFQATELGYGFSFDGGATWQSAKLPGGDAADWKFIADPAIAVDGLGQVYLVHLPYGAFREFRVAKSVDGGQTYGAGVVVASDAVDRPHVAVDLATNVLYAVWTDFGQLPLSIRFSKSTDQGASFTPQQQISSGRSGGTAAVPLVGPSGEVYVVWGNQSTSVWFDRSLDGGDSWLATDIVINDEIDEPADPLAGGFRNPASPTAAVDRSGGPFHGRIYAAWPDERFGDPDVLLSFSSDQGDTWSDPVRVNDDVQDNGADQFFPTMVVDSSGHVHVTFLDRRDDPAGLRIAAYLATSTDGGETFGPNVRLSSGAFPPRDLFFGDYTGTAVGGGKLFPFWPDARDFDQDVYTRPVDLADFDEDGRANDGDGNGQYADNRCTGGQTTDCDDNCPGEANPDQADLDGDEVGDACDNCPAVLNTSQFDQDRDGAGDACDPCPLRVGTDAGDPDGDGFIGCLDNCPGVFNDPQTDSDADGVGDACDACAADPVNDPDADGVCATTDNCLLVHNPAQADGDADGVGNVCDACPADPGQVDTDGDGSGDVCDCQPGDPNDFHPFVVGELKSFRTSSGAKFVWKPKKFDDVYSVSRGTLASLGPSSYGSCLVEGIGPEVEDAESPPAGAGFFYLVQAQNFDCGLGPLGYDSAELPQVNGAGGACQGHPHADVYAASEETIAGTVTGGLRNTLASDDSSEQIKEETTSGPPAQKYTLLEHRWTFAVPAGSRVEFHVEWLKTASSDGDDFAFEYSTDGTSFLPMANPINFAFVDDWDQVWPLPDDLSGTVVVRVVDTNHAPGGTFQDSVFIDELFIRSIP